ncbi:hypothetical protein P167DRAFT_542987 [Morchella conica CCBAS932]|uniref:Uncharacterized protein n=1 Tax=Morchella conica CCBAS932 TaxID=1392247 RepID=A0A3N4KXY7_9PEZI|nr:hypothetical protein P167DRAFT_542987 [Morchella conica CCBAS932]
MCTWLTITYACAHTQRIRKSTHSTCEIHHHEYVDSAHLRDPGHCATCATAKPSCWKSSLGRMQAPIMAKKKEERKPVTSVKEEERLLTLKEGESQVQNAHDGEM